MNTTIDFKTAKTIENMSRKIDGMERAVSGFFNKMSDIAERKYGDPQVYLAAVGPARDLSAILLEEAPGILPCFDETDDTFGISKELPVAGCYNPKQVLELSGKRYLTGPVVFVRFNMEGEYVSLTMGDLQGPARKAGMRSSPATAVSTPPSLPGWTRCLLSSGK